MKLLFTLISFILVQSVTGQSRYYKADYILEGLVNYYDDDGSFGSHDSLYLFESYELDEETDSLLLIWACEIVQDENGIIKLSPFKKRNRKAKPTFYKWTSNSLNYYFFEECSTDGVIKSPTNYGFRTTKTTLLENDSIVDQKTFWVTNKGDTTCHFLKRWVYRNDTLIEKWRDDNYQNDCSFTSKEKFQILGYSYLMNDTIIEENLTIGQKSYGKWKTKDVYDEFGNVQTRFRKFMPGDCDYCKYYTAHIFEVKFFRRVGILYKTEVWQNKKLIEKIVKKTIPR